MAHSAGAFSQRANSRKEVNFTSNSIFINLLYVAIAASALWAAIGYVIL